MVEKVQDIKAPKFNKTRVYYTKSPDYDTIYADAAMIALNEDGVDSLKMDFWVSHADLYDEIWHNKPEDIPEIEVGEVQSINREIKVRIAMSVANAKRFYTVLGTFLNNNENKKEDKKRD